MTDVQAVDTDRRRQTEDLSFCLMEHELDTIAGKILPHRTHHGGIRVEDRVGAHQHIAAHIEADPAETDRRTTVADGDIQPHTLSARTDTVYRQRGKTDGTDLADGITGGITDADALAGGGAFSGHRIAELALFIGNLIPCAQCRNITL